MIICKIFIWFIVFSILGYIWETCFCTITQHKWANRGFLYGPVIPIYGFGGTLAAVVFTLLPVDRLMTAEPWMIFIVCVFGSMVLEYVTSYVLERLFHAYWWDYSDKPFNINGRVWPPYSLGFGLAGLLVVYVFLPWAKRFTEAPPEWAVATLALGCMFLLGADVAMTVSAITSFAKDLARIDTEINDRMTVFYAGIEQNMSEARQENENYKELKKEDAQAAAEYRKQITEERLAQMVASASWFAHGRFMQIEGIERPRRHYDVLGRLKSPRQDSEMLGQVKSEVTQTKARKWRAVKEKWEAKKAKRDNK